MAWDERSDAEHGGYGQGADQDYQKEGHDAHRSRPVDTSLGVPVRSTTWEMCRRLQLLAHQHFAGALAQASEVTMSDTEQMVRIMRHAAGLLATQARKLAEENRFQSASAIAAMSYGRATLEMVAASVAPEGSERIGQIIGRLGEYNAWADKSTEIGMSDGELGAIGRFLRWVASDSGDVE